MNFKYRPLLKTRSGEAVALEKLSEPHKDRIFPIFQVGEKPPPTFAVKLSEAWSGRGAALDGSFNTELTGTTVAFDQMFRMLASNGIFILPSIEVGAPPDYLNSVKTKVGTVAPGLVLRTKLNNLSNAYSYAQKNGWAPLQTDLVIEMGHISELEPNSFAGYVSSVISPLLPPNVWRSVTLSGSSAPKDMSNLSLGVNLVSRQEWRVWHSLRQPSYQMIDYSDYATAHSDLTEPPAVAMGNATVSVRYTIKDYWIIVKGRATKRQSGLPMATQYRSHIAKLMQHADFNNVHPCWGDDRIRAIAADPLASPGGRSQWVERCTNRHLAFVAQNLP